MLLDLQSVCNQAYDIGPYDRVNYRAPPATPLPPDATAWADQLLKEAGLRAAKPV